MMSDDAAEVLATQVQRLSEQVTKLSEQVEQVRAEIHAQPRWPHMLLEWRRPPSAQASLVSVLQYHERASRRTAAIYYVVIAVLFVITALGLLIGSGSTGTLPGALRVEAGIAYLLVGVGQVSCIALPTLRYQMAMSLPTIGCAVFVGVVNAIAMQHLHTAAGVVSLIFWLIMAGIHASFALNTRGRLEQRDLTLGLIARLEERQTAGDAP